MNLKIKNLLNEINWNTIDDFFKEFEKPQYSHIDLSYFVSNILLKEIDFLNKRRLEMNFKTSGIPVLKTVEEFDFNFQPSINKNLIFELMDLDFINKKENIIFIGSPGVGKTHLAISLGVRAIKDKKSVYFITYNKLISKLKEAYEKGLTEEKIKQISKYKLLIIDEIGYTEVPKGLSSVLFKLIDKFYEKKSLIITTNKHISEWIDMFDDQGIAGAIIDRIIHHSKIILIEGKSYRTHESVRNSV